MVSISFVLISNAHLINPLTPTVAIWVLATVIKHPVPDRVEPSFSFAVFDIRADAQGWASEGPDVKNYKLRLNPVWHRMLYICIHMATVGVKGLRWQRWKCRHVIGILAVHTRLGYMCVETSWEHCSTVSTSSSLLLALWLGALLALCNQSQKLVELNYISSQ